jgi:hypothetical protein
MKNLTAFAGVALVFIYVIGSGLWVNTGDGWYLNRTCPLSNLGGNCCIAELSIQQTELTLAIQIKP